MATVYAGKHFKKGNLGVQRFGWGSSSLIFLRRENKDSPWIQGMNRDKDVNSLHLQVEGGLWREVLAISYNYL